MWTFPFKARRPENGAGAGSEGRPPSLRRKVLLTAFILFHFGCVVVWVLPGALQVRTFLLSRSVPLPTRRPDPATNSSRWRIEPQSVIISYLWKTGQWQHWNLFAPNPMAYNRFLGARVTYRSGDRQEWTLPRVEQLDYVRAHLEARYREYQYGMAGSPAALEDLARFFARHPNDPANPAVRVDLFAFHLDIPRHDRPELRAPDAPRTVDYSRLLRERALTVAVPLLAYEVRPEDLR